MVTIPHFAGRCTARVPARRAAPSAARLRNSSHSGERGTALFLVILVLTLLTAIGMFAMRSASLVSIATGYDRQSIQAAGLAEYAARASASYISKGGSFVQRAATERVGGCAPAYLAANPDAGCTVIAGGNLMLDEFSRDVGTIAGGLVGQLSPPGAPTSITGSFVTELTAPGTATERAGFVSGQFHQLTFTAIATVFPIDGVTTASCDAGARDVLSRQAVRAHVIVPAF